MTEVKCCFDIDKETERVVLEEQLEILEKGTGMLARIE